MKIVSLFANIGVAEAYLEQLGFEVVLANESIQRRAELYSKIYPKTNVICGDFSSKNIFNKLLHECKKNSIDIVIATPPCQGMSTVGQQIKGDERNGLIVPTVDFIKKTLPKYAFIENVPQFLNTNIQFKEIDMIIKDFIDKQLNSKYYVEFNIVDSKNYSVPQTRERAIILLTRKDQVKKWIMPPKHPEIITLKEVIGDLPTIDPFIKDVTEKEMLAIFPKFKVRKKEALKISKWHNPPHHVKRQIIAMMYTPTGQSAFNNNIYKPIKANGELVKGFPNTYKRQNWDSPAYTITMDNVKISSQNNVHPGRLLKKDINNNLVYSDPRTLTLFEIMKLMSLPEDWNIPANTSEAFIRRIIGEGIPPLLVKAIFENLK
jgi:DNA (cytosine-5)-methyltransferase 1